MSAAIRTRKPIVVERLEFAQKKSTLENEGTGRARRLSSFAYQQTYGLGLPSPLAVSHAAHAFAA
jgi:hypothetical protein